MIYKPSNCHPFASAEDITKCFLTVNEEGWEKPPSVYITGRVETNNLRAIGYKVRLYIDDVLAFESDKISPFSELPRFSDDKTVNTGVNGTYFAIPIFQSAGADYRETFSYNSIYVTGGSGNVSQNSTPCFRCDFIVAPSVNYVPGHRLSGYDLDSGWVFDSGETEVTPPAGWDGKLNGCLVTEGDSILFSNDSGPFGYFLIGVMLADGSIKISKKITFTTSVPPLGLIHIMKGKCCGVYRYYDYTGSGSAGYIRLYDDLDWGDMFQSGGNEIVSGDMSGLGDSQLSWEVVLYQGPEDYSSLVTDATDDVPAYFTFGVRYFGNPYYDMRVASGTILGSCSQRLHLSSIFTGSDGEYRLPGDGLQYTPVLKDTYCELYIAESGGYPIVSKLAPSFQIADFDASLGIVYPKDYQYYGGGLSQEALDRFRETAAGLGDDVYARFFKYSSNAQDTLSNEKVRVAFWDTEDETTDPSTTLVSGARVDDVILSSGDRVLWNTKYDDGCQNGIWVVGDSGEPPYRPADGDDYADYIGKVTLVEDGRRWASTVAESTAAAGGNFSLGDVPIFFREQSPVILFDFTATPQQADELSENIDLWDYIRYTPIGGGGFSTLPLPVLRNTQTIALTVDSYDESSLYFSLKRALVLELNPTTKEVLFLQYPGEGYIEVTMKDGEFRHTLYVKGVETTNPASLLMINSGSYAGKKYFSYQSNKTYMGTVYTQYEWVLAPKFYACKVLFNEEERTYISPSSSVEKGQILRLRDVVASNTLRINSFDRRFNCISHDSLSAPLPAAKNDGVVPPTPYKYDIQSCFRVSDQNGFVIEPPLTPFIQPTSIDGSLGTGYSAFADVSCFQEKGKAWNSARLVLQHGDDPERWQDTDWFHEGGLDTEFLGLEPGGDYYLVAYAKDDNGRITQSERFVSVPSEDEASPISFVEDPTISKSSENLYALGLSLYVSNAGYTSANVAGYFDELTVHSTGDFGDSTLDDHSPSTTCSFNDSTQRLDIGLECTTENSLDTGGDIDIVIVMGSPRGDLTIQISAHFYPNSQSCFVRSYSYSSSWDINHYPIFSGTFSGTLTAESDCSTQSVLLNYEPATGVGDWPNGLPPEQNGTYDIYRREYVDLKKKYSCNAGLPEGGAEQLWYGDWEPVALNVGTTNVRDFNVKQGHSYQYAIFPRGGASLKIERTEGPQDTPTAINLEDDIVNIAFDASMMGWAEATEMFSGITVSFISGYGSDDPTSLAISEVSFGYQEPTPAGLVNGYVYFECPNADIVWPVAAEVDIFYLGIHYSARVIFTSATEYTVEPIGDSRAWRKRLLANGGDPVYVQWDAWSLTELDEVDPSTLFENPTIRHPAVRKAYKANLDRIWLFRYDAEPGSQSINLTKGEISTLGKYTRFSSGSLNAEAGEMSAWLGSEVVPGCRNGYIERRRSTIWAPAATNEATAMLAAFRAMVASDKPKLLRDRKGRSWIVQVSGGSSSTMDSFVGTPTKISFSWKEIASTGPYVTIWGDGDELPPLDTDGEWKPNIITTP